MSIKKERGAIQVPKKPQLAPEADSFVTQAEQSLKGENKLQALPVPVKKGGISRVSLDLDRDAYDFIKQFLREELDDMKSADFIRALIKSYFKERAIEIDCEPAKGEGYTALARRNPPKTKRKTL